MLIIRWYLKDTCILVTDDSRTFTRTELKMLKDMISPYLYKFRDIGLLYTSIPSYMSKYGTFHIDTPHGAMKYSFSFTRGSLDSYMNINISNKHEILSKTHRNMFKDSSEFIGYIADVIIEDFEVVYKDAIFGAFNGNVFKGVEDFLLEYNNKTFLGDTLYPNRLSSIDIKIVFGINVDGREITSSNIASFDIVFRDIDSLDSKDIIELLNTISYLRDKMCSDYRLVWFGLYQRHISTPLEMFDVFTSTERDCVFSHILGRDVNTLNELVGDVVSVHNDKVVSQCLSTDYVAFLHAHHVVISVEVSSSLLYAKVMGSGYFKTDILNSLLYDGLFKMALHFSDT